MTRCCHRAVTEPRLAGGLIAPAGHEDQRPRVSELLLARLIPSITSSTAARRFDLSAATGGGGVRGCNAERVASGSEGRLLSHLFIQALRVFDVELFTDCSLEATMARHSERCARGVGSTRTPGAAVAPLGHEFAKEPRRTRTAGRPASDRSGPPHTYIRS
jgi:hypothetical protein